MAELDAVGLVAQLSSSFNRAAAREFDGTVVLEFRHQSDLPVEQRVVLKVDDGDQQTRIAREPTPADITLYFHSVDEAAELLQGKTNPVNAFMDGRFRSDGHLVWVFTVLSMFRAG